MEQKLTVTIHGWPSWAAGSFEKAFLLTEYCSDVAADQTHRLRRPGRSPISETEGRVEIEAIWTGPIDQGAPWRADAQMTALAVIRNQFSTLQVETGSWVNAAKTRTRRDILNCSPH